MLSLLAIFTAAVDFFSGGIGVNVEPVQVQLGKATIVGDYNATTGVDAFLGIKYADSKRFEHAIMVEYSQEKVIDATVHAPACTQINNAVSVCLLLSQGETQRRVFCIIG
jgi:hypothetical protein